MTQTLSITTFISGVEKVLTTALIRHNGKTTYSPKCYETSSTGVKQFYDSVNWAEKFDRELRSVLREEKGVAV